MKNKCFFCPVPDVKLMLRYEFRSRLTLSQYVAVAIICPKQDVWSPWRLIKKCWQMSTHCITQFATKTWRKCNNIGHITFQKSRGLTWWQVENVWRQPTLPSNLVMLNDCLSIHHMSTTLNTSSLFTVWRTVPCDRTASEIMFFFIFCVSFRRTDGIKNKTRKTVPST